MKMVSILYSHSLIIIISQVCLATAVTGYPKELPCTAQCTGPGIQWCIMKYDNVVTDDITWRLCIGDRGTINEDFPFDPSTISIIDNNTLAIEMVNSIFISANASCSILNDHNEIVCSSSIQLNVVVGT